MRNTSCSDCGLCNDVENVCLMTQKPLKHYKIAVVGEAPGAQEDEEGEPFVGKVGKFAKQEFKRIGIDWDKDIYPLNIVKCRPPENRTPSRKEIETCKHYALSELEAVKPKFVLLFGSVAMQAILNEKGISKRHGSIIERNGITYFLCYHPGIVFKQPNLKQVFCTDMTRFGSMVGGQITTSKVLNLQIVKSMDDFRWLVDDLGQETVVSYDVETNGLFQFRPGGLIYCLGLGLAEKQWIVPLRYPNSIFDDQEISQRVINIVARVLEGKKLTAYNGKFDNKWLRVQYGWKPNMVYDSMLALHLLDEELPKELEEVAKLRYNAVAYKLKMPIDPAKVTFEELALHNGYDVYYTRRLHFDTRRELKKDKRLWTIMKEHSMKASHTLENAEMQGIFVDQDKYQDSFVVIDNKVKDALKELEPFAEKYGVGNWNSPKQVGELLYTKLKLPILAYTKTKNPSVAEPVLKQLQDKHSCIPKLLKYRELVKTQQFFSNWQTHMVDGVLHPSFKITGTVTGRLSCGDPNLQNVPRDTFLRSLITAPPGWVLMEADYSQVELRITAMVSGDITMKTAYQTGEDLHRKTAATVSGKKPEDVTKAERKNAKAVNFGFIYGMHYKKFKDYARDKYNVELTLDEAFLYRKRFFELYWGLPSWHDRQKRLAEKFGYVRNAIGRIRHLPGAQLSDADSRAIKASCQRQGINAPVQSLASDILVTNLNRIDRELPYSQIRVVGNVHDAGLFIVKLEHVPEMTKGVRRIMEDVEYIERVYDTVISVPLEVEIKLGPWGSGKVIEKGEEDQWQL